MGESVRGDGRGRRLWLRAVLFALLMLLLVSPLLFAAATARDAARLAEECEAAHRLRLHVETVHVLLLRQMARAASPADEAVYGLVPQASMRALWSVDPVLMNDVALVLEALEETRVLPSARQASSWWRVERRLHEARLRTGEALETLAARESAAWRQVMWAVALQLLILALLTVAVLVVLRIGLLRPLEQLRERARRLAHGEVEDAGEAADKAGWRLPALVHAGQALDIMTTRYRRLHRWASRDERTGLPNQRRAREWAEALLRDAQPLHLVLVRMLNHAHIAAVYGEAASERVLESTAEALERESAGWAELVSHDGGSGFAILVRGGDTIDSMNERVQAFIHKVAQTGVPGLEATHPELVAGGASAPQHGSTFDALHGHAMIALEHATIDGEDTVQWAEESDAHVLRRELDSHEAMRRAVAEGRIEVWFQPVVDAGLASDRVCHVEALLRLRGEHGTEPLPKEMMDFLLASPELLLPASAQFFLRACETVRNARKLVPELGLAFNLSAVELRADHMEHLAGLLEQSGLPASALTLEITERASLQATDQLAPRLQSLRDRGARVVLDDFGTGYSSLSHLVELPLDGIKVDRAFVTPLGEDDRAREMVAGVMALAGAFGLETIAEGIENERQREMLLALGCRLHQGFLYSRAMSPADLGAWLVAHA